MGVGGDALDMFADGVAVGAGSLGRNGGREVSGGMVVEVAAGDGEGIAEDVQREEGEEEDECKEENGGTNSARHGFARAVAELGNLAPGDPNKPEKLKG